MDGARPAHACRRHRNTRRRARRPARARSGLTRRRLFRFIGIGVRPWPS
ncbi:hypothetical protein BMA10247_A1382 [Burkholderia mallei NCTC 10247]|nr:hypothetical protein BMA10247_A1382 [Burkholderia mallei NCTC 10247]